jgi:hypothetical protein
VRSVRSELFDRRWEELLADPASEAFFDRLEAEAEQAEREGHNRSLIPLSRLLEEDE